MGFQRISLEGFAWDIVPHGERPGVWELRQGTMTIGAFSSEAAAEAELAHRVVRQPGAAQNGSIHPISPGAA
jgi:hypothetical protein